MKKFVLGLVVITIAVLGIMYYKNSSINIEEEEYVSLYEQLIDKEIANSKIDLSDKQYIAIDTDSFLMSSEKNKQEVIDYMSKYDKDILLGSYNILNTKDLSNEGYLNGILISACDMEYKYNTINLSVGVYTSENSGVGDTYKATYKNKKWTIKEVSSFSI